MPTYELEKKLRSCNVSVATLRELENYMLDQARVGLGEEAEIQFGISIVDKFGTEQFGSFGEYHRETLPNATRRIKLEVGKPFLRNFIKVSFSLEPLWSEIQIHVDDQAAKERATGIAKTIDEILKEHANLNWIFYGAHNSLVIGVSIFLFLDTTLTGLSGKLHTLGAYQVFGVLVLGLYLALKLSSPYCEIDTKRNRTMVQYRRWFLNGLAGVFVFGIAATYLREQLLGF